MRKAGWMSGKAEKRWILFRRKAGLALVRRTCRVSMAMVELLGRNPPTNRCICFITITICRCALTALKDNSIAIPLHLSIIGFDDIPIARYTDPQLTTVRYPIASMAKLATELASCGAADNIDPRQPLCFMPTLVSPFCRNTPECGGDH